VDDALDADVLAQQLDSHTFSVDDFARLVWAVQAQLERVQAPARVASTRRWVEATVTAPFSPQAVARALDCMLRDVAQCERDVANAHLRVLAHHIRRDPAHAAARLRSCMAAPDAAAAAAADSSMPALRSMVIAGRAVAVSAAAVAAAAASPEPITAASCVREGLLLVVCGKADVPEPLLRFDAGGVERMRALLTGLVFQAELETTVAHVLLSEGGRRLVELDMDVTGGADVERDVVAHVAATTEGGRCPPSVEAAVRRCMQARGSSTVFRVIERHVCSALGRAMAHGTDLDVAVLRRVGITSAQTLMAAGELCRLVRGMHSVLTVAFADEVKRALDVV